jgi:hypothetical protein
MRSVQPLDGIVLRAPNPREKITRVSAPDLAKPIALQGLHDPRKLAGAVLWCLVGWVVVGGFAWLVGWAAWSLIRLALGAL